MAAQSAQGTSDAPGVFNLFWFNLLCFFKLSNLKDLFERVNPPHPLSAAIPLVRFLVSFKGMKTLLVFLSQAIFCSISAPQSAPIPYRQPCSTQELSTEHFAWHYTEISKKERENLVHYSSWCLSSRFHFREILLRVFSRKPATPPAFLPLFCEADKHLEFNVPLMDSSLCHK